MARMPGAEWIGPTPNEYPAGMVEHRGLVLHIEQSNNNTNVDSWFKDPTAQASAHFTNPKSGPLQQLVDTDDAAWTEMAGNRHWVSVEHEGYSGDSLTPNQVENDAHLLAWLHTTYNVPLQSTDDPNGTGLGWHGMGGDAWGGHFDCPGEPIKAQRGAIIARAQQILGQPAPMPAPQPQKPPAGPAYAGRVLVDYTQGSDVLAWQTYMHDVRRWTGLTKDGEYGQQSKHYAILFQQDSTAHGYPLVADGEFGPKSWAVMLSRPVTL